MITRTVKRFAAKAYEIAEVEGVPELREIARVEYVAATDSKTAARKAFAAQGVELPKGTTIYVTEIESILYGCELEAFLEIAKPLV